MERCHAQRSRFTPDSYLSECLRLSASSYRGTIFPESDPVLMDLDDRMVRIPKLYPAADGGYAVVSHSYVSGPSAAKSRGTDVVYYYDEAKPSTITAAIRFGLQAASIVLPAHGYAASEIDPPGRPRPIPQSRQLTPSFPLLFLLLPPPNPLAFVAARLPRLVLFLLLTLPFLRLPLPLIRAGCLRPFFPRGVLPPFRQRVEEGLGSTIVVPSGRVGLRLWLRLRLHVGLRLRTVPRRRGRLLPIPAVPTAVPPRRARRPATLPRLPRHCCAGGYPNEIITA